jgi:hypothetical protein
MSIDSSDFQPTTKEVRCKKCRRLVTDSLWPKLAHLFRHHKKHAGRCLAVLALDTRVDAITKAKILAWSLVSRL